MEGLLLAEVLARLSARLPSRRSAWRFLDDRTCELTLADGSVLRLASRPPAPALELIDADGPGEHRRRQPLPRPATPFQALLAARAVGDLSEVSQLRLDRVAMLDLASSEGFVPVAGVRLVFELTGRNANLVLLDARGKILGIEREVASQQSRSRRLRQGLAYRPPEPQDKLDPRGLDPQALAAALAGSVLGDVRKLVDGIGPRLQAALAGATGLENDVLLEGVALREVAEALARLTAEPAAFASEHATARETSAEGSQGRMAGADAALELAAEVRKLLARRLRALRARVADAEAALLGAGRADELRAEADLLLARVGEIPAGATAVELEGFDGERVELALDPRLSVTDNAEARYRQARRAGARSRAATSSLSGLRSEVAELEAELAGLASSDAKALGARLAELRGADGRRPGGGVPGGAGRRRGGRTAAPGLALTDPRGFEVFVGRSAKENDALTFSLARSLDVWLHAQGYRGAHVIIRAKSAEVPFDTILFAARLAAGHSEARDSDNVAVDYTQRKNVWRSKGGAPGAVHYAHHKTVYVTPARDSEGASGAPREG